MENPWVDTDGSDETNIVCDLARLRVSAAMSLKKIESCYKDIMGCSNYYEDVVDFNNESSRPQSENGEGPDLLNEYDMPDVNSICRNCRRPFSPQQVSPYRRPILYLNVPYSAPLADYDRNGIHNIYFGQDGEMEHPHEPREYYWGEKDDADFNSNSRKAKCPLKVTVPEPFQMTIRDENQKITKELKRAQFKRELQEKEEEELKNKFHSNPVPGHVLIPMYQKIMEDNEKRKEKRKQVAETIKNYVKPFNLGYTKSKSTSVPNLNAESEDIIPFRAKPAPKNVLDQNVSERLKNKEEVRKFRIKMRADKMLQKSSLPFSSRKEMDRPTSIINLAEKFKSKERKILCKDPPKTVSRTESKKVLKDWNSKIASLASKSHESVQKTSHEARYDEFLSSQSAPFYDVPIRMTTASLLRANEIRKEKEAPNALEVKRSSKETRERLQSQLKLNGTSYSSDEGLKRKVQEFRESRLLREKEYENELEEMQKRVESQPLLIQRQSKIKRKTEAEDQDKDDDFSDDDIDQSPNTPTPSDDDDDESPEKDSDVSELSD